MYRSLFPTALLLLVLTSCAGNSAGISSSGANSALGANAVSVSENISDLLDLDVEQTSVAMVFRGDSKVDIPLQMTLTNRGEESMALRRITVESIGNEGYRVPLSTRSYKDRLEPGMPLKLKYWTAVQLDDTNSAASRPLALRITTVVDQGGREFREVFIRQVNGRMQLDVKVN